MEFEICNVPTVNDLSTSTWTTARSVAALDGIQYPHRADGDKFLQVGQHWCVHVKEFVEKR